MLANNLQGLGCVWTFAFQFKVTMSKAEIYKDWNLTEFVCWVIQCTKQCTVVLQYCKGHESWVEPVFFNIVQVEIVLKLQLTNRVSVCFAKEKKVNISSIVIKKRERENINCINCAWANLYIYPGKPYHSVEWNSSLGQ